MSDRPHADYDELAKIEDRFNELLTAIIDHNARKRAADTADLPLRFVDLAGTLPPPRYSPADLIGGSDVVEKCLRWGIRAQYQQLCRIAADLEDHGEIKTISCAVRWDHPGHKALIKPGHRAEGRNVALLKDDERLTPGCASAGDDLTKRQLASLCRSRAEAAE
jgi:hypothetical protein